MKKVWSFVAVCLLSCITLGAHAQNFKAKQKEQEKAIKSAYKSKKITENEYHKLMDEQHVIKETMEKYQYDDYLDAHEKNVIHDKLDRAAGRLRRYKTNSERY
jgi:cell division protein FtsB